MILSPNELLYVVVAALNVYIFELRTVIVDSKSSKFSVQCQNLMSAGYDAAEDI